jgi:hypothetical protein
MSESNPLHDDEIDALLLRGDVPYGDARVREAALTQTIGVIRFRRRMRKCVLAMSLAGCYAAGLATMAFRSAIEPGTPAAVSTSAPQPQRTPSRPADPVKLSPEEIARRDADRSLFERGDVKEAVLGYDRFLNLASADHRAIAPEQDSWLLMALKDARAKEMEHDRSGQN